MMLLMELADLNLSSEAEPLPLMSLFNPHPWVQRGTVIQYSLSFDLMNLTDSCLLSLSDTLPFPVPGISSLFSCFCKKCTE